MLNRILPSSTDNYRCAGQKWFRVSHWYTDARYEVGVPAEKESNSGSQTDVCETAPSQELVQVPGQIWSQVAKRSGFMSGESFSRCEIKIEDFVETFASMSGEVRTDPPAQLPTSGQVLP